MEAIRVVLDKKLLQVTDHAAVRTTRNRSALVREDPDALLRFILRRRLFV